MIESFILMMKDSLVPEIIGVFIFFWPIWLPIFLLCIFFPMWIDYIRMDTIRKTGSVLLEIKIPKEITKSPAAMEIIFGAFYQRTASTFAETFWDGVIRPWFSLELVSDGGQIHFYIWTWPKFKNVIESHIYGQYPTVEIVEVKDYVKEVPMNYNFWGTQFKLAKPDPYPIKTYVDYGLDIDDNPKEEHKIDPLTAVIEYLGSIKPGHKVWIQIMFRTHRKENFMSDAILFKNFNWKKLFGSWHDWGDIFTVPDWQGRNEKEHGKKGIKDVIEDIRKQATPPSDDGMFKFPNPTRGQNDLIAAIERTAAKHPFESMIRGLYIWQDNKIEPSYIAGLVASIQQYSSQNMNGFKLAFKTDIQEDLYSDLMRLFPRWKLSMINKYKRLMLDAYKRRMMFYPPYKNLRQKPYVLSSEELATLFHFPGQVASTPTFEKIMSKKSEPPSNLPI